MDAAGVGERVRERREARGWSQRELDRRAGLSHGYVSKLEAGQIPKFSMAQLRKVAGALDITVSELIIAGGEEGPGEERGNESDEVEDIRIHLLALKEMDPGALAHLREIVLAMKENAERKYREEKRAERRRRKSAGQGRNADQEA